jgi:hypothetical protein
VDGLDAGDELYGPDTRDKHINAVAVVTITNTGGKQLTERPTTHEGHPARELVFVRDDGQLTALRVLAGERYVPQLAVTGSGNKDKPDEFLERAREFFDGAHVGAAFGPPITEEPPAVSAADLAAAYRADAKAADAKYKDRWLKVRGKVREADKDGKGLVLAAGEGAVVVRRAPAARRTVPVKAAGVEVELTGKCRGPGADDRVVLEDATVGRPARPH